MDLTDAVPTEVVSCSSEDPPHTGKRLSSQYGVAVLRALLDASGSGITDDSVGWHAEKFCEYPQEIVFRVCDPDAAPHVRSLVVVSHATLIAHRIEIFLSSSIVRDWRKARFDRLGFITLQSPQLTHCAAQELKTVPLSSRANEKITFLKLLIHTCHVHTLNIFNQVGLACFVVLAENSSRQADGESLVTAVQRRIKEERSTAPTMEVSPEIRPWPTTVLRARAKASQQAPSASQAVWIAERKEYVTPVELLTRIQLARERHAAILQNAVADYQRDQQQWAVDEFECVQWIDKLSQLNRCEVAARTVDERLHAQQQIDAALQSVRALDARVSQREELLQRLVSEALASHLANSPVKIGGKNFRAAKPTTVFRDKDMWVSLDSWHAREEFLWKVVEVVKCCGDDQRTTSQKVSREPNDRADCAVLDEAIQIVEAGLKDGHAQVFIAVTTLLASVIQRHPRFQEGSAWKQEVSLILKLLASRLDDHQPPVRNNAAFAIIKVAELTRARGTFVVHTLLVLTEKEEITVSPQTLYGLLKVFSALLASFHCCASIDISAKRILRFLVQHDALVHENSHVRDAARQLVVVLHSEVGSEPVLTFLRKKGLSDDTMSNMEQLMALLSARAETPLSLDGAPSLG